MPTDFDCTNTEIDVRSQSLLQILEPWTASITTEVQASYAYLADLHREDDPTAFQKMECVILEFMKFVKKNLFKVPKFFKRAMMVDKNFNAQVKQRSFFTFPEQEKSIREYSLYTSRYVAFIARRSILQDEIRDEYLPKLVNDDVEVSQLIAFLDNVNLEDEHIDYLPLLRLLRIHLLLDVKAT